MSKYKKIEANKYFNQQKHSNILFQKNMHSSHQPAHSSINKNSNFPKNIQKGKYTDSNKFFEWIKDIAEYLNNPQIDDLIEEIESSNISTADKPQAFLDRYFLGKNKDDVASATTATPSMRVTQTRSRGGASNPIPLNQAPPIRSSYGFQDPVQSVVSSQLNARRKGWSFVDPELSVAPRGNKRDKYVESVLPEAVQSGFKTWLDESDDDFYQSLWQNIPSNLSSAQVNQIIRNRVAFEPFMAALQAIPSTSRLSTNAIASAFRDTSQRLKDMIFDSQTSRNKPTSNAVNFQVDSPRTRRETKRILQGDVYPSYYSKEDIDLAENTSANQDYADFLRLDDDLTWQPTTPESRLFAAIYQPEISAIRGAVRQGRQMFEDIVTHEFTPRRMRSRDILNRPYSETVSDDIREFANYYIGNPDLPKYSYLDFSSLSEKDKQQIKDKVMNVYEDWLESQPSVAQSSVQPIKTTSSSSTQSSVQPIKTTSSSSTQSSVQPIKTTSSSSTVSSPSNSTVNDESDEEDFIRFLNFMRDEN